MGKEIREYVFEKDNEGLDEYEEKYGDNEDFKFHYNVLPHPYFGNIEKATVIFLAKNPSYSKYEDEYDTWKFFEDTKYDKDKILDEGNSQYDDYLEKTYLFKGFAEGNNKSFFNSWKWWNKKVIGEVTCNDGTNAKDIAFVNLCGYQSKEFVEFNYVNEEIRNWFGCSKESSVFETILKKNNVFFVVVWGRKEWSNFFNEVCHIKNNGKKNNDFFDNNLSGRFIVLNQYKSKSGDIKCGRNINTLEMILNGSKAEVYDESLVNKLKEYFKEK